MDIKDNLSEWGVNAIALIAGLMGGLVAIAMSEKVISFRSALSQVITAATFSGYGTEMLAKWWGLDSNPSVCGLIGLCLGICGMYVARGVIRIGKRFEKNPTNFLKNKDDENTNNH